MFLENELDFEFIDLKLDLINFVMELFKVDLRKTVLLGYE
jgi:hypothetical protein